MKDFAKFIKEEIHQQPYLWSRTYQLIKDRKDRIIDFMSGFSITDTEFIFTGAGSSFFVAEVVSAIFQNNTGFTSRAISSTELVTHPAHYINPLKKTVLISFARSGNSPESLAAINNSELISPNIYNIIITCNKEGRLANLSTSRPVLKIVLPPEANDKSLAMTSSVTSMILTAILLSKIKKIDTEKKNIELLINYTEALFEKYEDEIIKISKLDFDRAVFLGSGPFLGVAREAHLKMQELSDGQIISKFDSFLGFRHGPMAVINPKTLLVFFLSNNAYVQQYERDLIASVNNHNPLYTIAISENFIPEIETNTQIYAVKNTNSLSEEYLTLFALVPAQLLAMYKSLHLGLDPDSPSTRGAIHRVVKGVKIYPYLNNK